MNRMMRGQGTQAGGMGPGRGRQHWEESEEDGCGCGCRGGHQGNHGSGPVGDQGYGPAGGQGSGPGFKHAHRQECCHSHRGGGSCCDDQSEETTGSPASREQTREELESYRRDLEQEIADISSRISKME